MKIYYYIFIAIGISFLSCQTNDELEEISSTAQSESRLRADEDDSTNSGFSFDDPILEKNMEWVSYLIAETLIFSIEARNNFVDLIDNTPNFNGIVPLNILFDQNEGNEAFLKKFEEHFWCFEEEQNNCSTNGERPQGRVNPGGLSSTTSKDAYAYYKFLRYLLEKNCIEIYLPNGFKLYLENYQIASTAHPLNRDLYNDVYIHKSVYISAGIVSNNSKYMPYDIHQVNQYELKELQNIIVARPYRTDKNCTYQGYVDDFTIFLGH